MTGPNDNSESPADSPEASSDTAPAPESSSMSEEESPAELTPEEQMALYEESLKDTDWGHQPC